MQTADACRRPEVVDDEISHRLKRLAIADLDPSTNVFLKDFLYDPLDIGSLVSKFSESDSPRKTSLQNILGEFLQAVWINRLVIKLLHLFILVEAQGIKLERNVSAGQLGDKLTAQKIGIRSRNENGKIAVFTKTVNDSLELADILDFINEQILAPGERCIRSDKLIQHFSGLYMAIAPAV